MPPFLAQASANRWRCCNALYEPATRPICFSNTAHTARKAGPAPLLPSYFPSSPATSHARFPCVPDNGIEGEAPRIAGNEGFGEEQQLTTRRSAPLNPTNDQVHAFFQVKKGGGRLYDADFTVIHVTSSDNAGRADSKGVKVPGKSPLAGRLEHPPIEGCPRRWLMFSQRGSLVYKVLANVSILFTYKFLIVKA